RFEIFDPSTWLDLVLERGVWEDGKAADRRQRFVLIDAFGQPDLTADSNGVNGLAAIVEMQSINPMKELEADAAPSQRLVQRRDHDVTHPGGHFPEEGSFVLEKRYAG